MISFAKRIVIENGSSYNYELADHENPTWEGVDSHHQVFQLKRIDPADVTEDDKKVLTEMMNNIIGVKTIRVQLEEEVDKIYEYILSNSLHD